MFDDGTVTRLDRWRDDGGRQVPLITGPRGVGKSTAVGLFAEGYPEVVTLDLRNDPEHRRILSRSYSTAALLPAKRAWFAARPDVEFLPTDALTQEELCHAVHAWVRRCLAETTGKGASSPWNLSN